MKKILWKLLEKFDNNHGYTTPLQKRFKVGDRCKISSFKMKETQFAIGDFVDIIEIGRQDYLIVNNRDEKTVVYQFELELL